MLVLSRKISESILIGNDIEIIVTQIAGGKVKLGINAPAHVRVLRGELTRISPLTSSETTPCTLADVEKLENDHFPAGEEPALDFSTEYAAQIEDQMRCVMAV
jgi:carbon storage regulator